MAPHGKFLINYMATSNLLSNKLIEKWNNDNSMTKYVCNTNAGFTSFTNNFLKVIQINVKLEKAKVHQE
jgi:hypothetical protein